MRDIFGANLLFNRNHYSIKFWVAVFFALELCCFALPEIPVLKTQDIYFIQEIERTAAFLHTRKNNPELLLKMAILLRETGHEAAALEWLEELKKLELPPEKIEELNLKIRRGLKFAIIPVFRSEIDNATEISNGVAASENGPEAAAKAAEAAGKMELAAEEYLKLFRQTRRSSYLELAAQRYLWANKSRQALPLLLQLHEIRPRDRKLLLQLAEINSWHGDYSAAADCLEKALQIRYGKDVQRKLIDTAYSSGDNHRTEKLVSEFLTRYPGDARAGVLFAKLLLDMGQRARALDLVASLDSASLSTSDLELFMPELFAAENYAAVLRHAQAIAQRKISPLSKLKGLYFLAAANLRLGKPEPAHEQIEQAKRLLIDRKISISGPERREMQLQIMTLEASLPELHLDVAARREIFRRIYAIAPDRVDAIAFLAEDFRREGDDLNAEAFFAQALKLDPKNRFYMWNLADIAMRDGKYHRARQMLEKLFLLPDFADEAMLLEAWQKTGAWKKLADYIEADKTRLLPLYRQVFVEALIKLDRFDEVAELLFEELRENPFNLDAELKFAEISTKVPGRWQRYNESKKHLIENYHLHLVASVSRQIETNPENFDLYRQRAMIYGYLAQPENALPDLIFLLTKSPGQVDLLEQAAATAEWAGNRCKAGEFRENLAELQPENASNSLRLATLQLGMRKFFAAQKSLRAASAMQRIDPRQYFFAAMPVLLQSGAFRQARNLVEETSGMMDGFQEDDAFKRYYLANERIIQRDLGPVFRVGFDFLHDSDGVSLSSSRLFGRFNVGDHSFSQISVDDLAMSRDNNNQAGIRGKEINLAVKRKRIDREFELGLPIQVLQDKTRLFAPALQYLRQYENGEIGAKFLQKPIKDSPEAIRQGIFNSLFELTGRRRLRERLWLEGNAGLQKNSAGFSGSFAGLTIARALSYEPFRSLRYSFATEDNQSENSDAFYLEDFIQTHSIGFSGQNDFYHFRRWVDLISWDIYVGINNRSETFHGGSIRLEKELGRRFFISGFAGFYTSENNRFSQTSGYDNWTYGLTFEKREW